MCSGRPSTATIDHVRMAERNAQQGVPNRVHTEDYTGAKPVTYWVETVGEIPPREQGWPDFHRPDVEPIEANATVWAEWEVLLVCALSFLTGLGLAAVLGMWMTSSNADRLEATPLAPTESIRPEARP